MTSEAGCGDGPHLPQLRLGREVLEDGVDHLAAGVCDQPGAVVVEEDHAPSSHNLTLLDVEFGTETE